MKRQLLFIIVLSIAISLSLGAQDFGFGFDDEYETTGGGISPSVSISGEAAAELLVYVHGFSDGAEQIKLGDIFSGKLNFYAGISFAEAFINLKLKPTTSPVTLDEAFVRAYIRDFEIEAGLRKLTWGKADSFGPLDVINPLDYSQLTDFSNSMNFKIPRPMVHLSYRAGSFSKIEAVFVPTFEPLRFAEEGRWLPAQMAQLAQLDQMMGQMGLAQIKQLLIVNGVPEEQINQLLQAYGDQIPNVIPMNRPDTSTLKYAQAGLRFTTTIGSSDIGVQYYYGRLTRPAVTVIYTLIPPIPVPIPSSVDFAYNPYHQIGFDFAQVLYGFNVRAELAANITSDLSGDDETVYNPHLAWSLGFDRDLVYGINLNMQLNETIRLMNSKITSPSDIEAGTDMISTQLITALSKTFFKGRLEARAALFWELEAKDILFIPSLVWTKDALSVELSAGIFGGDEGGQFGQYWKNSFIKTVLKYSF